MMSAPENTTLSSSPQQILVNRFDSHRANTGAVVPLEDIIREISTPPEERRELISRIRATYQAAGGGKAGKAAIRDLKGGLPAVTFSATGTRREPDGSTGILAIDLDELGTQLVGARRQLELDSHCSAIFVSPSGDGLKALIKVPTPTGTAEEMRGKHRTHFLAVRSYIQTKLNLLIDPAASDLLRLCYLSYDPECRINPSAQVLDVARWQPKEEDDPDNRSDDPDSREGQDPVARNRSEDVVEALLRSIPPRPDYGTWLKVSAAVRNTLGDNTRAIALLEAWSPEEQEGEYRRLLESSKFSRIGFGTLVHHARRHGFGGVIAKCFYYGRNGYYIEHNGRYIPLSRETDLKQHLRLYGVDPTSPDCPTCTVRNERLVNFVGEVAGHQRGVHEFNGELFLVTKGPTIIESRPGGGEFVRDFLQRLLATVEPDQYFNVLAWLHRIRRAVKDGRRTQVPAVVIAGEAGDGKSLFIEVICLSLGGRKANAYKYLSNQSRFNSDLVGAELLYVDDDAAAKDTGARKRFAQFLKATLFAGSVAAEGKGTNAIQCAPVQGIVIAVNSDPHHLRVLPELDDTLRDKIILLKSSPAPLPPELRGKEHLVRLRLLEDLPGFLYEVDNLDPSEWIHPLTGRLLCHWNSEIVQAIEELSPERRLWELIENELTDERGGIDWMGTASQLETALTRQGAKNPNTARNMLNWSGACGTFLSRLAKEPDSPVKLDRETAEGRIQQYRIRRDAPPREECEELKSPFKNIPPKGELRSREGTSENPPHPPQLPEELKNLVRESSRLEP